MKTIKEKEFTYRTIFIGILLAIGFIMFAILTGCHKQEKDLLRDKTWLTGILFMYHFNNNHKGSGVNNNPIKWKITLKNHLEIDYYTTGMAKQYYEVQKLDNDSLVLFHSLDKNITRLNH